VSENTSQVRGGAEEMPLVSVLTPSFQQAAWLGDNLGSVAAQTYPRIEHVVADGGSTDGSVELLHAEAERRAASSGPALRWSSGPDEGQADAVNRAFAESTGEIIGWINSDDAYVDPRVIADVVAHFRAHPDVDVVYGHCLQVAADGAFIQVLWAPPYDEALLRTVDIISQPGAFIRRRALGEVMLDTSFHFAMDYELWLRLQAAGSGFSRIDRVVGIDRQHASRKSSTILDVLDADLARLSSRYDMRLGPEWERTRTAYYVRGRLAGGLVVPRLRPPYAFSTPEAPAKGLFRRQVATRRRHWPEEYRTFRSTPGEHT